MSISMQYTTYNYSIIGGQKAAKSQFTFLAVWLFVTIDLPNYETSYEPMAGGAASIFKSP